MPDLLKFKSQIFVETIIDDLSIKDSSLNKLLGEIVLNFILTNLDIKGRKAFIDAIMNDNYNEAEEITMNNIDDYESRLTERIKQEIVCSHENSTK